jgi:hypothetical protein
MTSVTFSFDPVCPWTWKASRWLVSVADARDLQVEWRSFSLHLLNGEQASAEHGPAMLASLSALRLVEALRSAGRNRDIGRFYTELGTRVHDDGEALTHDLVREAATAAGVADLAPALDDRKLDLAVRRSLDDAMASAGPAIGSPVLEVEGATRGLHGPILAEPPAPAEALAIWDAVAAVIGIDAFFEVKRGRP